MMIDLKQKTLQSFGYQEEDSHIIVANKYIIEKKIGKGSFGEVFKGFNKDTKEQVAIKVELSKTFQTRALIEGKILKKLQNYDGIPKLHFCGTEGDYNVLVLELLGPNLEDILSYCEQKLSMKTVLMVCDQLIQRMESIHGRGFLHRDIKSDNFLIGSGDKINKIYAIDFGLSKRYVHPHTGEHILIKKHKGLIGTARFASINAHLGLEQSRRDDLQALGYLMIYLAKGSLPWQKIKAKNKQQKYKKILDMKDLYTSESLAQGLPEEFVLYLNYVKRLEFEERPDYHYLRGLFISLLSKSQISYDFVFDWMIPKTKRDNMRKKIKRKFRTQQIKNEGNKIIPAHNDDKQQQQQEVEIINDQNNQFNNNNIKESPQENMIYESIQNQKFETIQDNQLNLKNSQNSQHLLEQHNNETTNRILAKEYLDPQKYPQLLSAISEKVEEASLNRSQISQIHLDHLRIAKLHSDISVTQLRQRIGESPNKLKDYIKIPLSKQSFKKQRKHLSHNNIYKIQNKSSRKNVGKISIVDVDYDENIEDDEANVEEVQPNNLNKYLFNINCSLLDKEKAATPSPVKSRLMVHYQFIDTFQGTANQLKQLSQPKVPQQKRSRTIELLPKLGFDNHKIDISVKQIQKRVNVQDDDQGSSMYTEYEYEQEQSDSFPLSIDAKMKKLDVNYNTSDDDKSLVSQEIRTKTIQISHRNQPDIKVIHDYIQHEKRICALSISNSCALTTCFLILSFLQFLIFSSQVLFQV